MKRAICILLLLTILPFCLTGCDSKTPAEHSDADIAKAVRYLADQGYTLVRAREKKLLELPEDMEAPEAEIFYLQGMNDTQIQKLQDVIVYDISIDVLGHPLSTYSMGTGETNVHVWISDGKVLGGSSAPYVYTFEEDEENPYIPGEPIPDDATAEVSQDYVWNLYGQSRHTLALNPPVRTPYPLDSFGNPIIPTPTPVPTPSPEPTPFVDRKGMEAYVAAITDILSRKSELNGPMNVLSIDMGPLQLTADERSLMFDQLSSLDAPIILADLQQLYYQGIFDVEKQTLGNYLLVIFDRISVVNENEMVIECRKYRSEEETLIMQYTLDYENGGWTFRDKVEMTIA